MLSTLSLKLPYYETDACKMVDVYIKEFKVTEVEAGFNSVI